MDNILDCFRGVDFSCHGVALCLVVGWKTFVIEWPSLVIEWPSLFMEWRS